VPRATAGRVLYVDTQGATVRKRRGRLVVEAPAAPGGAGEQRGDRETLLRLPAAEVSSVVLVGGVQLSTQAAAFLMREGITTTYVSTRGRCKGRLVPAYPANVEVRLAQFDAHADPAQALPLARAFVRGKLANMTRAVRRHAPEPHRERALRSLGAASRQAAEAEERASLNGFEGQGTRAYFRAFRAMLRPEDPALRFTRRSRRPPGSPANAVLGFLYALLRADVQAACTAAGLDPHVGFLHRPRHGRPALALDLMEPMRPLLADACALRLVNQPRLSGEHFEEREDGGTYLTEEGRKRCCRAYSQRRREEARHPALDAKRPYHRILEAQARRLARALTTGDPAAFQPFTPRA